MPQPNRLIHETSTYLLQHAYNPVDWYPWGPEALARAQAEDKPILLSVGYSACHWCHVMAHESFEDPETAAVMNEHFINIKVDREERPDIDAIYMEAVQALTGRGGWPMTVFLTPDGRPFYGGTYFPATPRYGMPGFRQVLLAVAEAWRERRHELEAAGARLAEALQRSALIRPAGTALDNALLDRAARALLSSFDPQEGGFGDAPKFPQPMNLDFLLHHHLRTGEKQALHALTFTLTRMARGGIYDQLGGGFHRYSTDARWLVPHFEKMLYDNAQLARTYLHAWQVTGEALYRTVAEEMLDYVLREMTSPEGAFYSSQDADSEGVEGKFFLWRPEEVLELLGKEDGRLLCAYFGVTPQGNFREGGTGATILHVARELPALAADLGVSAERLAAAVERGRRVLYAARARRVPPGRDEKVLAEWNGLMIQALAEAGAVLGRKDYLRAAAKAADFVLTRMAGSTDGALRLYRSWTAGRAQLRGYLEDHAAVGLALVELYQATFDLRWLETADALAHTITAYFHDPDAGGFFQTSADHERLVVRRKDFIDNAVPAGNSLAADLFLHLATLLGRPDYVEYAREPLELMAEGMAAQPAAFGRLLCALDRYLNPGLEVAIIGHPEAMDTRGLLAEVRRHYLPNSVLVSCAPDDQAAQARIPLLAGRGLVNGRATAYVCRNYTCRLPVTEPAALAAQLQSSPGDGTAGH